MSQTLTLVRGLPGTGKTTLAMTLPGVKVAADDFFENLGYFDKKLLKLAHKECQTRTRVALLEGHNVVVHNTFVSRWEFEPYLRMARRLGAEVNIIAMPFDHLTDLELASRNVHGVPEAAIARMRARWQTVRG